MANMVRCCEPDGKRKHVPWTGAFYVGDETRDLWKGDMLTIIDGAKRDVVTVRNLRTWRDIRDVPRTDIAGEEALT